MAQKPTIPKGTRDFSPSEMIRRNYIFDTVRSVFTRYGYAPIETPAMENLSSLLGKYGEEGDKLLFRILNSGDFLHSSGKLDETGHLTETVSSASLAPLITEKGLRYDLTVPFARFVVQRRNDIIFPFKRYQIQPVWRADRPQKGRYREFFQCDVDVIGSHSLIYEVELVQIILEVFNLLGIPVTIKVNNRKILAGIAESIGEPGKFVTITTAIDKLEKIGLEKVKEELLGNGMLEESWFKLKPFLEMQQGNQEKIITLSELLKESESGMLGLNEMKEIFHTLRHLGNAESLEFDLTLARGLNYYTGTIIEVKANEVAIGSICGGGRYDDLTGIFGLPGVSGVGVSFGADRIYDVLNELDRFPKDITTTTKVLLINFGKETELFALGLLQRIRKEGIPSEIYPDNAPLKKQFSFADNRGIHYVVIAGQDELAQGMVTLKDMRTGSQRTMPLRELFTHLQDV
ncbi:MAG: histidine--tRNA ligase [Bacteroidales bacterium]